MPNQSRSPSEHSEADLLPCPLCATTPHLVDLAGWEVLCECGLQLALQNPSRAAVVAAWNRRTTPAEAGERTLPELPTFQRWEFGSMIASVDPSGSWVSHKDIPAKMIAYGQQCARYAVEEHKHSFEVRNLEALAKVIANDKHGSAYNTVNSYREHLKVAFGDLLAHHTDKGD